MQLTINTSILRKAAEAVAADYYPDLYPLDNLDYDSLNSLRRQAAEIGDFAYAQNGESQRLFTVEGAADMEVSVTVDSDFDDGGEYDGLEAIAWFRCADEAAGFMSFRTFITIDKLWGSTITPATEDGVEPTLVDQLIGFVEYVVNQLNFQLTADARFWMHVHTSPSPHRIDRNR